MATSTAREENDTRIKKNLIEMQVLEDTFNSLDELESKFNMISLPENVNMIRNKNHIVFFFHLTTEEKPTLRFSLKVSSTLDYEMWFDDKIVEKSVIPESPNLLDSCSITSRIIDQLNNMKINDITVDIELQNIISKIDNIEHYEQKKLSFVAEQLSLVMIKGPRRRRYSPDLLTIMYVAKYFTCIV